jgi:hypothetical protein
MISSICEGKVCKPFRPMSLTVKGRGMFHCRLGIYSPLNFHGRSDVKGAEESGDAINRMISARLVVSSS